MRNFISIHWQLFIILRKITQTDKRVNLIHFGSDTADIHIRIRINPEIRIRIVDWIWPLLSLCFLSALVMFNVGSTCVYIHLKFNCLKFRLLLLISEVITW